MSGDLITVDDVTLLAKITRQEAEALSILYDRYGRLLFSVA